MPMVLTIRSGRTVVVVVESGDSVVSDRLNMRRMSRIVSESVVRSKKYRINGPDAFLVVGGAIPLQRYGVEVIEVLEIASQLVSCPAAATKNSILPTCMCSCSFLSHWDFTTEH